MLDEQRDRLDHVLTTIENDKKLLRPNEIDQFRTRIFRSERKSQRCRDGPRNMLRVGEAFQVNKMDFSVKLLGNGAANGQGNCRLANAAWPKQCHEPLISKLVADLRDEHFAPYHHDRSNREAATVRDLRVPALRAVSERNDGADERVAPSLDVCDVAVAELAVIKRLADRSHVDPEASFLDGHIRPDVVDQLLLRDYLAWTLGKVNEDVEGPVAKGKHNTVAPERPFANRKFERTELQLPMNGGTMHESAK